MLSESMIRRPHVVPRTSSALGLVRQSGGARRECSFEGSLPRGSGRKIRRQLAVVAASMAATHADWRAPEEITGTERWRGRNPGRGHSCAGDFRRNRLTVHQPAIAIED